MNKELLIKQALGELREFLYLSHKVQWIGSFEREVKVYVRKSVRMFNDLKLVNCLDIASIDVEQQYQRQGLGTSLITAIHLANPFEVTYIENVMNRDLERWIGKNDWIHHSTYEYCYYKLRS